MPFSLLWYVVLDARLRLTLASLFSMSTSSFLEQRLSTLQSCDLEVINKLELLRWTPCETKVHISFFCMCRWWGGPMFVWDWWSWEQNSVPGHGSARGTPEGCCGGLLGHCTFAEPMHISIEFQEVACSQHPTCNGGMKVEVLTWQTKS